MLNIAYLLSFIVIFYRKLVKYFQIVAVEP